MTGPDVVLAAFAVLVVAASALAVLGDQVVRAALWLVVALGGLAGVYLALGAEVVALVQVLVYVGAVVVLLLFALMLTRAPIGRRGDLDGGPRRRCAAAGAGLGLAVLIAAPLLWAVGDRQVAVLGDQGGPQAVGTALFAGWLLPFELLSLLLLGSLIAALAVSGARAGDGPSWSAARRSFALPGRLASRRREASVAVPVVPDSATPDSGTPDPRHSDDRRGA